MVMSLFRQANDHLGARAGLGWLLGLTLSLLFLVWLLHRLGWRSALASGAVLLGSFLFAWSLSPQPDGMLPALATLTPVCVLLWSSCWPSKRVEHWLTRLLALALMLALLSLHTVWPSAALVTWLLAGLAIRLLRPTGSLLAPEPERSGPLPTPAPQGGR